MADTRLSSDLPSDEKLVNCPIDALFDDIRDEPPLTFLEAVKPVDALELIPKLMARAARTYDYAKRTMTDPAVISAKLSVEEYAAIVKYCAEDSIPTFFSTMNSLCYEREQRAQLKCFVPYMWLLLHALQKLDPYPEPKVHRGVKLNLRSKFPKGREFTWWSFGSTTKTIETLEGEKFCGQSGDRTIFSITLRQQQARDISPFSPFKTEGEVLLPPGCSFRVVGSAAFGGLTIIDLEELPSEFYVLDLSPGPSEGQHQQHAQSARKTGSNNIHQHDAAHSSAATASAATSSSRRKLAAALPKGGGKSVLQAGQSPSASAQEQQPFQSHPQQAAASASPASASAAAAPSACRGKPPPAATAPTGAGKSASFWFELGWYKGGGNVEGQKDCYETALAIAPKYATAWNGLGVQGGGRVGGWEYSAKDCYETALAIDPKYADAWHGLGVVRGGRVGGWEYSEEDCLETALAIDPKHAYAWNGLGFVGGGRVGGWEYRAKDCFETALAIDWKYATAWYGLGRLAGGRVGGWEYSAKDCLETALAIDPKHAKAWMELGDTGGGQVHGKHYSRAECYALYKQYKK